MKVLCAVCFIDITEHQQYECGDGLLYCERCAVEQFYKDPLNNIVFKADPIFVKNPSA